VVCRAGPGRHDDRVTTKRPRKLDGPHVSDFIANVGPGWAKEGEALVRTFNFERYGDGLGFAVAVGVEAEKADHHPDLFIGWRKVRVLWTTHDAGGITELDLQMAERCDAIAGSRASS
jgi:4a-hydroxytetrahydrobiopterin dehydratase